MNISILAKNVNHHTLIPGHLWPDKNGKAGGWGRSPRVKRLCHNVIFTSRHLWIFFIKNV